MISLVMILTANNRMLLGSTVHSLNLVGKLECTSVNVYISFDVQTEVLSMHVHSICKTLNSNKDNQIYTVLHKSATSLLTIYIQIQTLP